MEFLQQFNEEEVFLVTDSVNSMSKIVNYLENGEMTSEQAEEEFNDIRENLMDKLDTDYVGILWDVNHPYMFIGEEPLETWQNIGRWIYHTHWKDSKLNSSTEFGFEPCLMGDGVLPHKHILDVLKNGGYNGFLSLEWEIRWHPDLPDPDIAFPQYINYMKELMKL